MAVAGQRDAPLPLPSAHLVDAAQGCSAGQGPSATSGVAVAAVALSPLGGGWDASAGGAVAPFGGEVSYGSLSGPLNRPIVGMVSTPDGGGYWLVATDGGIFSFGDAGFEGSTGGMQLNQPIVGMAPTPSGRGYWLVASDGGIFSFGDAPFEGSTGAMHLNQPIVGMAPTPDGSGYWLVASDGGIFSFGDAPFEGSTGAMHLNQPIVGMAPSPGGRGYWLVASDGGIFSFGGAPFEGSTGGTHLSQPIVGMVPSLDGQGYTLVARDAERFPFGDSTSAGTTAVTANTESGLLGSQIGQAMGASLAADVNTLVDRQAPGDPNGLWVGGDPVYWRSASGPGLAAAAVAGLDGDGSMRQDAVQTFDALIATHLRSDGSFTAVAGTPAPQSPDVDTMFFATNLGMALWALRGQLSSTEVATWTAALTGAADYLVAHGNLSWYSNGNIVIGNALVMALAFWASGDSRYQADYQTALSFALAPPQNRWPGYGLVYTTVPTQASGADGAGYFAESGGGAPGFDADYVQLQLDQLTRLYLVTRSPVVLRLINLVFNQLWPLVDPRTWTLDTSGGTRHPQQGRLVSFSTPALALLATVGGRGDLVRYVSGQVTSVETDYRGSVVNWSPGAQYGFGVEAASFVLLAQGTC